MPFYLSNNPDFIYSQEPEAQPPEVCKNISPMALCLT